MDPSNNSVAVIKRVKLEASHGLPPLQYRIQLVDEFMFGTTAAFMEKHFLPHENICKSIDGTILGDADEGGGSIINRETILSEGISLVACLEDDRENRSQIICCNVLTIQEKGEKVLTESIESKKFRLVKQTLEDTKSKADVYELYDCDKIVEGYGLAVAADYQGRGVAGEVLRAREEVCRLTNTPVSATIFTSGTSQRLAERCGYKTLAELDLTTYRINGQVIYPRPVWPVIKWMAIRYF